MNIQTPGFPDEIHKEVSATYQELAGVSRSVRVLATIDSTKLTNTGSSRTLAFGLLFHEYQTDGIG